MKRLLRAAWLAALLMSAAATQAALTLNIVDPDRNAVPGTVQPFVGTITNETGVDLSTAELFFSFFNVFDPAHLSAMQRLGVPDVVIPDGQTSAELDLFDAELSIFSQVGATYFADLVLQSIHGDESEVSTVRLHVVPEPDGLALLLAAFAAAAWTSRVQRRRV